MKNKLALFRWGCKSRLRGQLPPARAAATLLAIPQAEREQLTRGAPGLHTFVADRPQRLHRLLFLSGHNLPASREALTRQDAAIQELLVVRRVPAAYKQCLAECVRR